MKKIISLIAPLLVLCSCQTAKTKTVSHNYDDTKDSLITWRSIFTQDPDDYLVYFYSESCGHCNKIKQEVISFYLKDLIDMYFVCTDFDAVYGTQKDLTGVDSLDDFYIFGTPFLSRITDHKVSEYYLGTNAIKNYINQFKN